MFTPKEIAFFKENREFFGELRKPQYGGWVYDEREQRCRVLLEVTALLMNDLGKPLELIPLFRLRQLLTMLEEEGWKWAIWDHHGEEDATPNRLYSTQIVPRDTWAKAPFKKRKIYFGPTPLIAVGKALMEVRREER